jgi:hypothetical protein
MNDNPMIGTLKIMTAGFWGSPSVAASDNFANSSFTNWALNIAVEVKHACQVFILLWNTKA